MEREAKLDIETLHEMVPKETPVLMINDDWKQWKDRFNELNDRVWTTVSGTAKQLSEKPRKELQSTDRKLDELLSDDRLPMKITKRRQFADNVRYYYFYSVLIVSALQVLADGSRPRVEPYRDSRGGQQLEVSSLIRWIKDIRPKLVDFLWSIETHRMTGEWPLNWTLTAETRRLIIEVDTYETYSESLMDLALKHRDSLRRYVRYYTEYTPELFDMLVIQRRYLTIVSNITVHLPKRQMRPKPVREVIEYEVNRWFETLVIIYILYWIVFHTFLTYRLFFQHPFNT